MIHPEQATINATIDVYCNLLRAGHGCVIGWSSGKDSEVCLQLLIVAMLRVRNEGGQLPRCFVLTVDTLVENPEVVFVKRGKLSALRAFIELHQLPLAIHTAAPTLMSSWQARVIGGRGLPTYVSSSYRQCTHELKISASEREARAIRASLTPAEAAKLVTVLGSRLDESATRAGNIAKFGGDHEKPVANADGHLYLYPIKHWELDDVWYFLGRAGQSPRSLWQSYLPNNDATILLYKESAGGECVVLQADTNEDGVSNKNHGSCGARHGCWACVAVPNDKSMAALLEDEKHAFMRPLAQIRNFLAAIQYDWSRRRVIGRTLHNGYLKLQPDCFTFDTCRQLLKACLTADRDEQARADSVKRRLASGEIAPSAHNLRMAEPQFEVISMEHLFAIEWNWCLIGLATKPWEALAVWKEVFEQGESEYLPELVPVARTPMPEKRWFHVGEDWYDNYAINGLFDADEALLDSPCTAPTQIQHPQYGGKPMPHVDLGATFQVVADNAEMFMGWEMDRVLSQRDGRLPMSAIHTLIRFGVVTLPAGKLRKFDEMATRAALLLHKGLTASLTWATLLAQGIGISHAEYTAITAQAGSDEVATGPESSPARADAHFFDTLQLFDELLAPPSLHRAPAPCRRRAAQQPTAAQQRGLFEQECAA